MATEQEVRSTDAHAAHEGWAGAAEEAPDGPVTVRAVLMLLSSEEVAQVIRVGSVSTLDDGEEYLDLARLELGVRRHVRSSGFTGRILPRRAVRPQTWSTILARLAAPRPAAQPGA